MVGLRHVGKFRKATPPDAKVIVANTLNFKPISDRLFGKNCKGTPVHGGVCASKLWPLFSARRNLGAQHPLRAEIWSSESRFGQV